MLDADGKETGMFVPAGEPRYPALQLLVRQKQMGKTANGQDSKWARQHTGKTAHGQDSTRARQHTGKTQPVRLSGKRRRMRDPLSA
jgi:hypothetical protein